MWSLGGETIHSRYSSCTEEDTIFDCAPCFYSFSQLSDPVYSTVATSLPFIPPLNNRCGPLVQNLWRLFPNQSPCFSPHLVYATQLVFWKHSSAHFPFLAQKPPIKSFLRWAFKYSSQCVFKRLFSHRISLRIHQTPQASAYWKHMFLFKDILILPIALTLLWEITCLILPIMF